MNHHSRLLRHHLFDPQAPHQCGLKVGVGSCAETHYDITTQGQATVGWYSVTGSCSQIVALTYDQAETMGRALLAAAATARAEAEQQLADDDHDLQMALQRSIDIDDHDPEQGPLAIGMPEIQSAELMQRAGHTPAWARRFLPQLRTQIHSSGDVFIVSQEPDLPFTTTYAEFRMDRSGVAALTPCLWYVEELHTVRPQLPWLAVMDDFGRLVDVSHLQRREWVEAANFANYAEHVEACRA
jgi:hypothetical protein